MRLSIVEYIYIIIIILVTVIALLFFYAKYISRTKRNREDKEYFIASVITIIIIAGLSIAPVLL